MATLREYLNAKIKAKGSSVSAEKAKASKYKSIAAAKKALEKFGPLTAVERAKIRAAEKKKKK